MIIAVHQPQFMPWLGYFDKIFQADHFVLLDCVQYKKNEWQNRNRIKTVTGLQWLTVPVTYRFRQKISQVTINNSTDWQSKHLHSLLTNYNSSPHFQFLKPFIDSVYNQQWGSIAELNIYVVKGLAKILGITTPISIASELGNFTENPDQRLIDIVKHLKGDTYLAGKDGKNYMDVKKYKEVDIEIQFQEYEHPVYSQQFGNFQPNLSILDLLFNYGLESLDILRGKLIPNEHFSYRCAS